MTLTYNDEHLPEHGSLRREHLQQFMRKLRKGIAPKKVRFYGAGEYGEANYRPHYHVLLFGHMPRERTPLSETLYRSVELEQCWTKGNSSVGHVTMASAMYVAQYVLKKVDQVGKKQKWSVDPETGESHKIEPEFSRMSRRPGVGKGWYEKYGEEVERLETVVVDGNELGPPRYYDELLRQRDEAAWEVVKLRRERKYGKYVPSNERMARELIARERLQLYSRKVLHATAPAVYDS